jgi:hypothetical protein
LICEYLSDKADCVVYLENISSEQELILPPGLIDLTWLSRTHLPVLPRGLKYLWISRDYDTLIIELLENINKIIITKYHCRDRPIFIEYIQQKYKHKIEV